MTNNLSEDKLKHRLEELRSSWDKEWQRNELLESKAFNVIQVSGVVTTLIFGFVAFIQSTTMLVVTPIVMILIILSVSFGSMSIITAILAIRVRTYLLSEDYEQYFKPEHRNKKPDYFVNKTRGDLLDENKISEELNTDSLIARYVFLLKSFHSNNENKGSYVPGSNTLSRNKRGVHCLFGYCHVLGAVSTKIN